MCFEVDPEFCEYFCRFVNNFVNIFLNMFVSGSMCFAAVPTHFEADPAHFEAAYFFLFGLTDSELKRKYDVGV